jgi:hypothetical protein
LVVLAIILWNTIYLERAIKALRQHGIAFPNALLKHISPIGWEHINLTFLSGCSKATGLATALPSGSGTQKILGKPVTMPGGDLYPSIDYWMSH